jgi:branched-subunit amino acid aminotransferase/4-amino-4-deoxychorismate lyase
MSRPAIETMRAIDRRIPLWPWHAERLRRAGWIHIPDPSDLAEVLPDGRIRVRLEVDDAGWRVTHEPLGPPWHGLVLDDAVRTYHNPAPEGKWRDRSEYESAFSSRTEGTDDAILTTAAGTVSETTRMSLFWLRDGILHTPDDTCAPLQGVARSRVCQWSPWPVRLGRFTMADLCAADCAFGANAVRGVVWIRRIGAFGWEEPTTDFIAFQLDYERRAYG